MDGLIRFIFSFFMALLTLFIGHKLIPKFNKHSIIKHGFVVLYLSLFLTLYNHSNLTQTLIYYASLIFIFKLVYRNSTFVASISALIIYWITLLGSMIAANLTLFLFTIKVDYRAIFASGSIQGNILFILTVFGLLNYYHIFVKSFKKGPNTNFKFDTLMVLTNSLLFALVFVYQKLTFINIVDAYANGIMNASKALGFNTYFLVTYCFVTLMSLIVIVLVNRLFIVDKNLERYKIKADTDEMTGVLSREAGLSHLKMEMSRAIAFKHDLTIAYIDVNDLKVVNDQFGHIEGDKLLKTISDVVQTKLRDFDVVTRLGGDEFLVVFVKCNKIQAQQVWQRISEAFLKVNAEGDFAYKISASVGIAQFDPKKHNSLIEYVHDADAKMYDQKKRIKEAML